MKIFMVILCIIMPVFSMDMHELNKIMLLEEDAKCIFDHDKFIPVSEVHKMGETTIEIINNIPDHNGHETEDRFCGCSKTRALIIGSLITAASVSIVALITGMATIIVAIIKK